MDGYTRYFGKMVFYVYVNRNFVDVFLEFFRNYSAVLCPSLERERENIKQIRVLKLFYEL